MRMRTLTLKRLKSGLHKPCMRAQHIVRGAWAHGTEQAPARRRRSWARRRWRRAARARPRPDSPTTASPWAWPFCSRRRPATRAQARPGATASLLSAPEGVQGGSVARLRCARPGACCAGRTPLLMPPPASRLPPDPARLRTSLPLVSSNAGQHATACWRARIVEHACLRTRDLGGPLSACATSIAERVWVMRAAAPACCAGAGAGRRL